MRQAKKKLRRKPAVAAAKNKHARKSVTAVKKPTKPSSNELVSNELVKIFHAKYKDDPIRFESLPGRTTAWDPQRLVLLYRWVHHDSRTSQEELAITLGLERSSISRKFRAMNWPTFEDRLYRLCTMSHDEYLSEAADQYRLQALAKEALTRRRSEVKREAFQRNLERKILSTTPPVQPSLPPFKPRKKSRNARTPEHMTLLLSDMHVGQEFSSADTGGINAYNVDVFKRRATNLRDAVLEIRELHSELYPIPELHVLCLGDMVQGSNMAGNWGVAYNDSGMDINEQSALAANTIVEMISSWSRYFDKIIVSGVVGNHGRAGAMKNSDKVSANWDNVTYAFIRAKTVAMPNVEVNFGKSWWRVEDVNGTKFMLVHGDHVRSSIGSLLSQEQRLQALAKASGGDNFDVLCLGHFHSHQEIETSGSKIIVNGSFVGGDIYSLHHMSVGSRPTQTILGVHPRNSVTWKYCLDLDLEHDRSK